jgi:hypothetical protein
MAVTVIVMIVLVAAGLGRAAAHHLEQGTAAGAEETHQQRRGQQEEDDVEVGRVVPLQAGRPDVRVALRRDQPERAEGELDDVAGDDHGDVEDPEQSQHHPRAGQRPV